jgi:hypothetical protein
MPPRRSLPPDAELAVKGHVEPVLINGGQTIKSLSAVFLADLERHWRVHGPKVLDVLAEKYPQAYFGGMVALSKGSGGKWVRLERSIGALRPMK